MPRGYSEYEPLRRALASLDFTFPAKPAVREVGGPGWSSKNIPLILGARALLRAYVKRDAAELRFWLAWFGQYLEKNHASFQFGEEFSRIYGLWHYQPVLVAEVIARAAGGFPGVQSEAEDWLRAFFGYLVLCSNGKRPRKILDHGEVDRPEPVYGDGPEIAKAGYSVAWAGKRSWSRGDDPESPVSDRTGNFGALDQAGIQELLGFLMGERIPPQREIVETYHALDKLASRFGVEPAWRPHTDELATARAALGGNAGALMAVVTWVADWPLHVGMVIERTRENGVTCLAEALGTGSTSGLTCVSIMPDGRTVYICANDGRRQPENARALTGRIEDRGARRVATSANDLAEVEADVAPGPVVFSVRVGPEVVAELPPAEDDPPHPPPVVNPPKPSWWARLREWVRRVF